MMELKRKRKGGGVKKEGVSSAMAEAMMARHYSAGEFKDDRHARSWKAKAFTAAMCAAEVLRDIALDREKWWLAVFALSVFSYSRLVDARLRPAVLGGGGISLLDADLHQVMQPNADIQVLVEGLWFVGAPCWLPATASLVFSEGGSNRVWRHEDGSGFVRVGASVLVEQAGCSNACADWLSPGPAAIARYLPKGGKTAVDADDGLLFAEAGDKRVSLLRPDGTRVSVAAADVDGVRLNGPTAILTTVNGDVLFADAYATDASRLKGGLAGRNAPQNAVYRLAQADVARAASASPAEQSSLDIKPTLEIALGESFRPEALAWSPDAKTLYVADAAGGAVWAFDYADAEPSRAKTLFFDSFEPKGAASGLAVDDAGRVYVAGPDAVYVVDAQGKVLGVVRTLPDDSPRDMAGDGHLYVATKTRLLRVQLKKVKPAALPAT
eukprot:CAMPEP_0184236476 /NCGR_PEP_ID=MMETSP0976-20121227/25847_1 /TAXON_ID=483370 /ORGANISM="non described non described, Strain CCMP2097" /LENGTH=438 /DNA_ID=CAMNT_0026541577 /DNA_START=1 /DNA_END=1317 /DNA_ORIENTATION=+